MGYCWFCCWFTQAGSFLLTSWHIGSAQTCTRPALRERGERGLQASEKDQAVVMASLRSRARRMYHTIMTPSALLTISVAKAAGVR